MPIIDNSIFYNSVYTITSFSVTGTAGETLALYDVVYMNNSDGKYYKAANNDTLLKASACGIVSNVGGIAQNATGTILKVGSITNNSWNLDENIVYLSTAGGVTTTKPTTVGQYLTCLGNAESATTLFFNPDYPKLIEATYYPYHITFDNGSSAIAANSKATIYFPMACTIVEWTLLSADANNTSGSIVIDLWVDSYANFPPTVTDTITASAKPTISSATKGQSSTLTGWTTSVSAGRVMIANVDSCTSIKKCVMCLKVQL